MNVSLMHQSDTAATAKANLTKRNEVIMTQLKLVHSIEACTIEAFEMGQEEIPEQVQDGLYRAAWRYCRGNQAEVARVLGVNRGTARKRLHKAGCI